MVLPLCVFIILSREERDISLWMTLLFSMQGDVCPQGGLCGSTSPSRSWQLTLSWSSYSLASTFSSSAQFSEPKKHLQTKKKLLVVVDCSLPLITLWFLESSCFFHRRFAGKWAVVSFCLFSGSCPGQAVWERSSKWVCESLPEALAWKYFSCSCLESILNCEGREERLKRFWVL